MNFGRDTDFTLYAQRFPQFCPFFRRPGWGGVKTGTPNCFPISVIFAIWKLRIRYSATLAWCKHDIRNAECGIQSTGKNIEGAQLQEQNWITSIETSQSKLPLTAGTNKRRIHHLVQSQRMCRADTRCVVLHDITYSTFNVMLKS